MKESKANIHQAYLFSNRAERIMRSVVNQQLENSQLSMNEWLLLGVVAGGPKHGLTLSQVAEGLDVSQPQVTALMANVLGLRLVKQKVSGQDRRSRLVLLTARGKRLVDQIQNSLDSLTADWREVLPADQLENYIETLKYITGQNQPADKGDKISVRKGSSRE